jgi:hypothetical protein
MPKIKSSDLAIRMISSLPGGARSATGFVREKWYPNGRVAWFCGKLAR